jgi:hypothetical protein
MSTKRSEPLSPMSGERCAMLMWSVTTIRLPGPIRASRLPEALVCTSTWQPKAFSVCSGTCIAFASPSS